MDREDTISRGHSIPKRMAMIVLSAVIALSCIGIMPSMALAAGTTATFPITGTQDYREAYAVLELVNAERSNRSLPPLIMDQGLLDAAMLRAAENRVFFEPNHKRPNGTSCFTAFPQGWSAVGENIAAGYTDASAVMSGWMNSPGHRDNILAGGYTSIGVGCFYQGGVKYWVQTFARKASVPVAQPANRTVSTPVTILKSNYTLFLVKSGSSLVVEMTTPYFWPGGDRIRLDSALFTFSSSNGNAGVVDAAGVFSPKPTGGQTTIIASLKSDPTVTASTIVTVSQATATAKVTIKKVISPKKKTLKATWGKVSGASGYQIQRALNKSFTKSKKSYSVSGGASSKTVKSLKSKKQYYVRVRAYKTVDGVKVYGPWSAVKKVKVK